MKEIRFNHWKTHIKHFPLSVFGIVALILMIMSIRGKAYVKPKHDVLLSQEIDWHREAIAAFSDWPWLFHDANLSSGTAGNREVCLGLSTYD